MNKLFHEADVALDVAKREFTSVGSLSVMGAFTANQACEYAVRDLWYVATSEPFPANKFTPYHKPAIYLKRMNVFTYFSNETQQFLDKMTGYALDEARYENTQAYKDYTKSISADRCKVIIEGTEKFIEETKALVGNQDVCRKIIEYRKNL